MGLTFIQFRLITKIRNDIYDHFHKLTLSFFDQKKSGELTSIVVNDVANMRVALGASFHKLFVEPINIFPLYNLIVVLGSALPSIVGVESFVRDIVVVIDG